MGKQHFKMTRGSVFLIVSLVLVMLLACGNFDEGYVLREISTSK